MIARLLRPANREYQDAVAYHNRQDPRLGHDFVEAIERAIAEVEQAPDRWPEIEYGVRRHLVKRFQYAIIYRPRADHIEVIAVMHLARPPGYWHGRIRP